MLDFSRFDWLSFDCYGTLIDWETGLLGYLRPLLQGKGCDISDARILALYSEFEPREQAGHYRSYREVLAGVVRAFARELRFEVSGKEADGLAESIRELAAVWRYRRRIAAAAFPLQTGRAFQYRRRPVRLHGAQAGSEVRWGGYGTAGAQLQALAQQFRGAPAAIRHSSRAAAACCREFVPRCGACAFAWDQDRVGESQAGESLRPRRSWRK